MATHEIDTPHRPHSPGARSPMLRRLDTFAVVWWAVGAVLAVVDVVRGGHTAPTAIESGLLGGVPDAAAAVGIAVLAVLGAVTAAWARWGWTTTRTARALTAVAAAVVLAGAVPLTDATVLTGLGYLPVMLLMVPFSATARGKLDFYVEPAFLIQTAVLAGAVLLAVSVVRYVRRSTAACERCGRRRDGIDPGWTTPAAAARWGRVATLLAAAIPAFYGITRIAWALGIPLGYSRENLESVRAEALAPDIGLGCFALVGAALTLGLVQRWGDSFPRWTFGLAGRQVPVRLAVIPATLVAVVVLPAGMTVVGNAMQDGMGSFGADTWGAILPPMMWPLWSVALGAATYAYWLRRRGTCATGCRG
ncbi:hypothetical protein [Microbacterium aerolatum]|uniref:Uncharacterized protein n=1 Tax=Microbacterium aerolatum TaxID=153731 RepID=A0A511ANU7_9MICO|nr:hypothetical protein [Microbacterium aerolatum]GEK87447.1 hypothetical protein MAE01_26230 [Microbacterium aerolatum]GGB33623.1 hypothetical protein GCM10007198_25190 [Microbacterium aerolatum]